MVVNLNRLRAWKCLVDTLAATQITKHKDVRACPGWAELAVAVQANDNLTRLGREFARLGITAVVKVNPRDLNAIDAAHHTAYAAEGVFPACLGGEGFHCLCVCAPRCGVVARCFPAAACAWHLISRRVAGFRAGLWLKTPQ